MNCWRSSSRFAVLAAVAVVASTVAPVATAQAQPSTRANALSATLNGPAPTNRGDVGRDGFYPNQPGLSPSVVASPSFGQLASTAVTGQVLAQPLVVTSQGTTTVFVATEGDWIYGLDPTDGAVAWSRQVGIPVQSASWNCRDISPTVGITSTPTYDPATNAVYFVDATYLDGSSGPTGYFLHSVAPSTGKELAGYPVAIGGTAQNAHKVFAANREYQRPGLLMLGGTVYIAFSSHCDAHPYQGWIMGVSTATASIVTRFVADATPANSGAGIWQAGGGLASDGVNQLLVAVGNGVTPPGTGATPGKQPPLDLSNAVVRLRVDASGALVPTDFFSPVDSSYLNDNDLDYGSGAPVLLPDSFGTTTYPHLVVAVGKEGYVDLLNRDNLGGIGNGPGGGDAVVSRVGPFGGIWATPAIWPGDGGYLYVPSTVEGSSGSGSLRALAVTETAGVPTLVDAGASASPYGFGSSSPIVTSSGTTSGSAVVWSVRMADGSGAGAQLEAYSAVPRKGTLDLLGRWPVGTAAKFNAPGVGDGRLYLATADGHVLTFGSRTNPAVTASPLTLAPVALGNAVSATTIVKIARATTITAIESTSSAFTVKVPPGVLNTTLHPNATVPLSITFAPLRSGSSTASLTLVTTAGVVQVALSGIGLVAGPHLTVETKAVSLGGTTLGSTSSANIVVTNTGTTPSAITAATLPSGSVFSIVNPTALTATPLASGASRRITVEFVANAVGVVGDKVSITADGSTTDVLVTAAATAPSTLQFLSGTNIDFGNVAVGAKATKTISFSINGGTAATVVAVTPPAGSFIVETPITVGTPLSPDATITLSVTAQPTSAGPTVGSLTLVTSLSTTPVVITLSATGTGTGYSLAAPGAGWRFNGSAVPSQNGAVLTPASPLLAGTALWPVPVSTSGVAATFSVAMTDGSGADGVAMVFADPMTPATAVGDIGEGFGFSGLGGIAVAFGTFSEAGAPSENFVGVTDGLCHCDVANPGALHWLATAKITSTYFQGVATPVSVSLHDGKVTVGINGTDVLTTDSPLGSSAIVGFSGGTGELTNRNAVRDVHLTISGSPTLLPMTAPSSAVDFGAVHIGSTATRAVTVTDTGPQPLTITASKPPASAEFFAPSELAAGTVLAPGASLTLSLSYAPAARHVTFASWQLSVFDYPTPLVIRFSGSGIGQVRGLPVVTTGSWLRSGSATRVGNAIQLTGPQPNTAGAAYLANAVSTNSLVLRATLHSTPGARCCGDGTAIVFGTGPTTPTVGANGWGVGFAGTHGLAIVFGEFPDPGAPGETYVGLASGMNAKHSGLNWLATTAVTAPIGHGDLHVTVSIEGSNLKVWIGATRVLAAKITNPGRAFVGFTAGTGAKTATHVVSDTLITVTS